MHPQDTTTDWHHWLPRVLVGIVAIFGSFLYFALMLTVADTFHLDRLVLGTIWLLAPALLLWLITSLIIRRSR